MFRVTRWYTGKYNQARNLKRGVRIVPPRYPRVHQVAFDAQGEHTHDGRGAQAGADVRIQASQRRQTVALRRGENHFENRSGAWPERDWAVLDRTYCT